MRPNLNAAINAVIAELSTIGTPSTINFYFTGDGGWGVSRFVLSNNSNYITVDIKNLNPKYLRRHIKECLDVLEGTLNENRRSGRGRKAEEYNYPDSIAED